MTDEFLIDIVRVKQRCTFARDDCKRAGETKRAGVYIRAIVAIEDVQADLKKEIKRAPKAGTSR